MTMQRDVLAAEDRFFQALLQGDGAALRGVVTPDFLLVRASGTWQLASAQGTPIAAAGGSGA
jgi:hypothetical protein